MVETRANYSSSMSDPNKMTEHRSENKITKQCTNSKTSQEESQNIEHLELTSLTRYDRHLCDRRSKHKKYKYV